MIVTKDYIGENDHVLIIDDFLESCLSEIERLVAVVKHKFQI